MRNPPKRYIPPFSAHGSSIVDANGNYVAELSAIWGPIQRDQMTAWLADAANAYAAQPQADVPQTPSGWRCFHCDEVFADRQLAEDHFGFSPLLMPACIDPLRGDERAMNKRAMDYERLWRKALKERDDALALSRPAPQTPSKRLSDFTDAEIASEHHARAMHFLGDQTVGVEVPMRKTLIGGTNFCGHGMMAALCPTCSVTRPQGGGQ